MTIALALMVALTWSADRAAAQQQQPEECFEELVFTGASQTLEVPDGVDAVRIDAYGAQGGNRDENFGGLGASATGTEVAVSPGDEIEVIVGGAGESINQAGAVGGAGGFGGGGNGGGNASAHVGAGGGGASTVRIGGELTVVAGGGGGGAHGSNEDSADASGGAGGAGGLTGEDGAASTESGDPDGYGRGATATAGGAGGAAGGTGLPGQGGAAEQGGDGGDGADAGGGGGGGLFGGGGGGGATVPGGIAGGAGGGGGSSFGQGDTTFETGVQFGDGLVTLTYVGPLCGDPDTCVEEYGLTRGPETFEVPLGVDEVTIDAYGAQGGNWTSLARGGLGGGAIGTVVPVAPGDEVEMLVGGRGGNVRQGDRPGAAGGFNGGGRGGANATARHEGAGGGGASTVSLNGETLVIAGGGGGGAHGGPGTARGRGGPGGLNGGNGLGAQYNTNGFGRGASTTAGGAGGPNVGTGSRPGQAGSLGQGGRGGNAEAQSLGSGDGGGGGGGGLYGGGGGAGGQSHNPPDRDGRWSGSGGGGGSSFGQDDTTFETGVKTGNGLVRLTYNLKGCGVADLEIEKSAPAEVEVGGEITWTMTVTNNGPEPSTGSVVSDVIPDGVTDAATETDGCEIAEGVLECEIGPLDVDESTEIELTGTASMEYSVCMPNAATVVGDQFDPDETNNEASVEVCTPPAADLALAKTGPATVAPGGQIAWTLTVTNHGPDASPATVLEDAIPAGITGATSATPGCAVTGATLRCELGTLAVGASSQVVLTGTAPASSSTCVTNSGAVRGGLHDTNQSNNGASAVTCTEPRADVTIDKTVSDRRVLMGETVVYRLVVKNNGPDAATGVTVDDRVPGRLAVRSARASQGDCAVSRRRSVSCGVGTLAVGQEVTITIRARALRAGGATNTATVDGKECPTHPCDDDPAEVRIVKPKLRVSKKVGKRVLQAGETTTYRIRVHNPSKVRLRRVRTCDRLPAGLVYVWAKPNARMSKGRHCWRLKRLGARKSKTYRVKVRALPGAGGRKVNRVVANSPDAKRDRAKRAVRVIGGQVAAGGVTG